MSETDPAAEDDPSPGPEGEPTPPADDKPEIPPAGKPVGAPLARASADDPEVADDTPVWKREALAGLTTFLTMSYIVVVNPQILSVTGLGFDALVTATVLVTAFGSILMGLFARLPYALAPGMGINAFFTYELCLGRKISPEIALGLVVWSGIVFLILSLTPFRRELARAIPVHLRQAVAAGIGLFLAFIGFQNAGLIADHPATLVTQGPPDARQALFLIGLLVAAVLLRAKKPYAFVAAIAVSTLGCAVLPTPEGSANWATIPDTWVQRPDASLFLSADIIGAFDVALLAPLLTLLFTDLFDSLSTFLGVAEVSGLVDEEGEPLRVEQALTVDAGATLAAGLVGTSPATTYIESTAGIEVGGRTGLTAVVAGVAFLPLMWFSPVLAVIPKFATAPILVIVGALMARAAAGLGERPLEERIPAFLVMALIPLSFSITSGLLWGFLLHPILFLFARRQEEVRPMMWFLFVVAVGLQAVEFWGL